MGLFVSLQTILKKQNNYEANNSQPNDDQFSENVPTVADMLTTLGYYSLEGECKVYVWYKVFGDDTHSDSKIEGPIEVTVTDAND